MLEWAQWFANNGQWEEAERILDALGVNDAPILIAEPEVDFPWWVETIDVGSDVVSTLLTVADIAAAGPTGEGIGPAIAVQAGKKKLKEKVKQKLLIEVRKIYAKEIKELGGDIHAAKELIFRDKALRDALRGENFDILVDRAGNVVLKTNQSGRLIPTGVPPSAFNPNG